MSVSTHSGVLELAIPLEPTPVQVFLHGNGQSAAAWLGQSVLTLRNTGIAWLGSSLDTIVLPHNYVKRRDLGEQQEEIWNN